MASVITPVAKKVYVCDSLVRDPNSGKVSLLNLWHTVRVPVGNAFPYPLARICVFAWLRDGLGQMNARVDVVQASTGDVIRRTNDYPLHFPAKRVNLFFRLDVEQCVFPEPGEYLVELFCRDEFVDDQVIQLISE